MSATGNTTSINKRKKPARGLFVVIVLLIAANIAGWFFYGQIDLTRDKRYTITGATRKMLQHLDTKMEVIVFLTGKQIPAPFQKLANSTENTLQQFREISDNKVTYRVVDPLGNDTTALATLNRYHMSGIPVTINEGKKGNTQKMIFPWALVTVVDAQGQSLAYPVFLQEVNTFNLNRQTLLKSEILLEYNLANAIHQLSKKERIAVAYLTGNGEQLDPHVAAMISTLQRYYIFDSLNIDQATQVPARYKTLFIQRPVIPFTDQQKFKLDQYVMNGGHILWSLNTVTGNLDSIRRQTGFNAMPVDLNLNDLLFNYGVRVNTNLVEDAVNYAYIPLQARSNNAETSMFPWVYFPVLKEGSDHPIVKNLNGVLGRFVSSIDTVGNGGNPIQKTILLSSSRYSKSEATPAPVILGSAIEILNPATFTQHNLAGAVLLEGVFNSAFSTHRPVELSDWIAAEKIPLKDKADKPGKMIVISDADIMTNDFNEKTGPTEMGLFVMDPTIRYDNQAFLLNCMEYLNDDENLLEARNKNFESRILDPKVVADEKLKWQFINIGIPVAAVLIFGAAFFFIRKKRYA